MTDREAIATLKDTRDELIKVGKKVDTLNTRQTVSEKVIRLQRKIILIMGTAGAVGFGIALTFILLYRSQLAGINRGVDTSKQIQTQINDCLQPEGKCRMDIVRDAIRRATEAADTNRNGKPDSQEILDAIQSLKEGR
jgi:hypothetical protein